MSGQNDIQNTLREMWETRPSRPRDDRKVAGVAAAIARRYDIDPVLVRVGFVVSAFYGIGLLLYLAGWVALPDAAEDPSRREPHPVLLVALIIAAIGTGSAVIFGSPSALVGLAVAGGLLFMLHRSRADQGAVGRAAGWPVDAGAGTGTGTGTGAGAGAGPATSTEAGAATVPTATGGATATAPAETAAAADASAERPEPPAWDPLGAAPFAWDLPEPSTPPGPPTPPRPGGWLAPVTIGLALLAGGIAGAAALSFGEVAGLRIVFGVVLAVLGLGLVVGAFLRRGRGLILLAIPLLVLTYALTAAPLQGWRGAGELTVAPTTAAAVAPLYERSAGDLQIDLRGLDLALPAGTDATGASSAPISTKATVDAGNIDVYLPPNADVTVTCHAGLGHIDCLGQDEGGPSPEATVTDLGRDGVSSGRPLLLDVSAGLGNVEVHRG